MACLDDEEVLAAKFFNVIENCGDNCSDKSSLEPPPEITITADSFEETDMGITALFSNKNNKTAQDEFEPSLPMKRRAKDENMADCRNRSRPLRRAQMARKIQRIIVSQWRDEKGALQFQFKEPRPGSRWSTFKTGPPRPGSSCHASQNMWEKKLRMCEIARLQD